VSGTRSNLDLFPYIRPWVCCVLASSFHNPVSYHWGYGTKKLRVFGFAVTSSGNILGFGSFKVKSYYHRLID